MIAWVLFAGLAGLYVGSSIGSLLGTFGARRVMAAAARQIAKGNGTAALLILAPFVDELEVP